MSNHAIDFSINRELAEKLNMALKLNQESSQEVMTRLMKQYVSETFSRVSQEVTSSSKPQNGHVQNSLLRNWKNQKRIPKSPL